MQASQAEKNTFGADVKLHPITRMPLEQGIGCRPIDEQAQHHCNLIEREHGKHVADAMREKLAAQRAMSQADIDLKTSFVEEENTHGHHSDRSDPHADDQPLHGGDRRDPGADGAGGTAA